MSSQAASAPRKLEELKAVFRRNGLPLTEQRRVILETLAGRTDHPTADRVFEDVRRRLPGVSRTTVYRVLDTLVRVGLTVKISTPGSAVRFDPKTGRHHHLLCLACEKIVDLEDPALDRLPAPAMRGFEIRDYSVYFRGLCPECRAPRPANGRRRGSARR